MKPLLSYFHGRRRHRLGPLLIHGHCYPDGVSMRRHFVIAWRYRTNRPLRFRLDDALHRALPRISPRSVRDHEIRVEHSRYAEALEQILDVRNTRLTCDLHGGPIEGGGFCACGISLDAAEKAKQIARRALGSEKETESPC